MRRSGQQRANFLGGAVAQRSRATPRLGRRQGHGRGAVFELPQVELDLGDLPVLRGPREGLARAVLQVQVQHHVVERRVAAMAVPFPILGAGVQFDAAAHDRRIGAIREADGGFREIRTSLVVPHAELHDLNPLARRRRQEVGSEIPREPMGLQLQLALVRGKLLRRGFAEHPVGGVQEGGVTVGELHGERVAKAVRRCSHPPPPWQARVDGRRKAEDLRAAPAGATLESSPGCNPGWFVKAAQNPGRGGQKTGDGWFLRCSCRDRRKRRT